MAHRKIQVQLMNICIFLYSTFYCMVIVVVGLQWSINWVSIKILLQLTSKLQVKTIFEYKCDW